MAPMNRIQYETNRANRILARIRRRQLELALNGRVTESARYADLAQRVRRQAMQVGSCCHAA